MKPSIEVFMGEAVVPQSSDSVLITFVGSCVALCIYDPKAKLGGMAHIMLPQKSQHVSEDHKCNGKYADQALTYLLGTLKQKGSDLKKIKAKMSGGAQIFSTETGNGFDIGKRNIESVKKLLKDANIQLLAEETGKNHGRWVKFDTHTGQLVVKGKRGETVL